MFSSLQHLAEAVARARAEAGLTQGGLAVKARIGKQTVTRIENAVHTPERRTVGLIATALFDGDSKAKDELWRLWNLARQEAEEAAAIAGVEEAEAAATSVPHPEQSDDPPETPLPAEPPPRASRGPRGGRKRPPAPEKGEE